MPGGIRQLQSDVDLDEEAELRRLEGFSGGEPPMEVHDLTQDDAQEVLYTGKARLKNQTLQLQLTRETLTFTRANAADSISFPCTAVREIKRQRRDDPKTGKLLNAKLRLVVGDPSTPCDIDFTIRNDATDQVKAASFEERDRFEDTLRQHGGGIRGDQPNQPTTRPPAAATTALATARGESPAKIQKRLEGYRQAVRDVSEVRARFERGMAQSDLQAAEKLSGILVKAQIDHDEKCTFLECRLRRKPRPNMVAAGLLYHVRKKQGFVFQFDEYAQFLKALDGKKNGHAEVSKNYELLQDLLTGFDQNSQYTCGSGASGELVLKDGDGFDAEQWTSLVPRLCGMVGLPYKVEREATELLMSLLKEGTLAVMPQTLAAAAISHAHDKLAEAAKTPDVANASATILIDLAEAAGLQGAETIRAALLKLTESGSLQMAVSSMTASSTLRN